MTPVKQKPCIWLCDLTYTQQTIASDIMPVGVAGLLTYLQANVDASVDGRIFKYPEALIEALEAGENEQRLPNVLAFTNYVWNRDLSAKLAAVVKHRHPEIVIVFGGPNYPTVAYEQEAFLRRHAMCDYYIVWEGEKPFAALVKTLIDNDFDMVRTGPDIPSLHYIDKSTNAFCRAELEDRLRDLDAIPSPYLCGMMDEFFDGKLLPILQTKRGCPFSCTFCVEGSKYYSKVATTKSSRVIDELEYIGQKMHALIEAGKSRTDLHISDSNFGMFKDDIDVCKKIGELQQKYGYPQYVGVATGKNQKQRVLQAAKLMNGALRLSGAVQSLDELVLENIERKNINEQELMSLALEASELGANSYSEIILGLPGDNIDAHFNTIRKVIEADFNSVCLYQLMLLPGTELASAESVEKWQMQTRYRALPRCYGCYDLWGHEINACEIEQICVANSSMTLEDYLNSRRFHLIVNVFYNDGVFMDLLRFLRRIGLSKYDFLQALFAYKGDERFNAFVADFISETSQELWQDKGAFEQWGMDRENILRLISGELGANLIFKYKSLSLTGMVDVLADVAMSTVSDFLETHAKGQYTGFAHDLIRFAQMRMTNIFNPESEAIIGRFNHDVLRFSVDGFNNSESMGAEDFEPLENELICNFVQNDHQRRIVRSMTDLYGSDAIGLSRIVTKTNVRRLFRNVDSTQVSDDVQLRASDAALSGLNQFV